MEKYEKDFFSAAVKLNKQKAFARRAESKLKAHIRNFHVMPHPHVKYLYVVHVNKSFSINAWMNTSVLNNMFSALAS